MVSRAVWSFCSDHRYCPAPLSDPMACAQNPTCSKLCMHAHILMHEWFLWSRLCDQLVQPTVNCMQGQAEARARCLTHPCRCHPPPLLPALLLRWLCQGPFQIQKTGLKGLPEAACLWLQLCWRCWCLLGVWADLQAKVSVRRLQSAEGRLSLLSPRKTRHTPMQHGACMSQNIT